MATPGLVSTAVESHDIEDAVDNLPQWPGTHRRATYSVASGQRKKWTLLWLQHGRREALASWLIRGLSLGAIRRLVGA